MSDYIELGLWSSLPTTADENSREAAESMVLSAGNLRRSVMQVIARWGPIAEWQVSEHLNMAGNTTRPRIYELHHAGYIERAKEKGTTPSGRSCWLYVASAVGRMALE